MLKDLTLPLEKLKPLLHGKQIRVSYQPLKHGENIFTSHLVDLLVGEVITIRKYNISLDKSITDENIIDALTGSPLNQIFALRALYVLKLLQKHNLDLQNLKKH